MLEDNTEPTTENNVESLSSPEIDEMTARLDALMKQVNAFEEQISPFMARQQEIKKEKDAKYQEYLEYVQKLNDEDHKIQEQMFETRKAMREARLLIESEERKIAQEKRRLEAERIAAEQEAKFAAIAAEWDRKTMAAPWREWAKDHQMSGAKKIAQAGHIICADGMGLGKTLTSTIALDMIRAATESARPDNPYEVSGSHDTEVIRPCGRKILYFCPATMIKNVEREVRRWAPHRSVAILGGMSKAQREFVLDTLEHSAECVVVINYEAWRKQLALIDRLIAINFDTVIVDEAHNVKDRKSIAYRGINRILKESNDGRGVEFVLPMTGTPILNKPQELFSLLTLVDPYHFYSENYFLRDFCQQNPYTLKWEFKTGGLDSLAKKIANIYFRRTKDQAGIILPPKTITVHEIEIDEELYPEQARARKEMRTWGSIMLDAKEGKAISAAAMIAVYTRLRQIETWPAGIEIKDGKTHEVILKVDIEESQKLDYIIKPNGDVNNPTWEEAEGLLPEVWDEERVVLFSQFKAPLHELRRRIKLAGKRAIVLDGDTPPALRDEIATNFDAKYNEEPKWDVVLCNYKVGGVGMNMTAATQMIIVDEEWNPGKRDQAYDRIHRMGQDKPVSIHVLRAKRSGVDVNGVKQDGGIDTWLAAIIEHKENVVQGFNEATDAGSLAEMGKAALDSGLI
ncbi:MAG TPA: SNF2-related protein [Patescibacteria group bacterium]|nr:SNF2-related protein [Patescibacteria group bacterium]